jgi:hypothetical protein
VTSIRLIGLAAIEPLALRVAAARERLLGEPADVAAQLDRLVRDACSGRRRARDAMLGCSIALAQGEGDACVAALAREAEGRGLEVAASILRDAAPWKTVLPRGRLPEPCAGRFYLTRYLRGTLRPRPDAPGPRFERWSEHQLHRTLQTSHVRERLLEHPDPHVVRRILESPATRLTDVLAIASRRPTSKAIAREVCASVRWIGQVEVREALVANPFVPTGMALKLLPTVPARARRALTLLRVHPLLQRAAAHLDA